VLGPGPAEKRRALCLELAFTVFVMREFKANASISLAWHKRVRGACFVRITPSVEERRLRARLMRDLPGELEDAVAFLETADLGERAKWHLEDACFECGGAHFVRYCPQLAEEDRCAPPQPASQPAPKPAPQPASKPAQKPAPKAAPKAKKPKAAPKAAYFIDPQNKPKLKWNWG